MLHPVLGIDELLRLIIAELKPTSQKTVLSLALTCRSLEEPVLSLLWEQQDTLIKLLKVLPNHTWVQDGRGVWTIVSGWGFLAHHLVYLPSDDRA